jgi:acyl carrier protein phosphodiesterase
LNFLAHAYLSFNNPEILVGNMVSDFVKGNKKFDYPILIQNGITLHRLIDEFTDNHQATKNAKQQFKQELGLYAGAFVDICYDYFLANDANEFEDDETLQCFAINTYRVLDKFENILPEKFLRPFASMKQHNWLLNYKTNYGIERSFAGLTYRAKYINKEHKAFDIFLSNKTLLESCYDDFFKDVKSFSLYQFNQLINS